MALVPCFYHPGVGQEVHHQGYLGFFWSGRRDLVARRTVCLPKGQGGFGVIDFDLKAKALPFSG
jgi:hypothetical protein